MRRAAAWAVAALVTLGACTPGQGAVGASAELSSVFRFAEYPGARFIDESIYPASVGPFSMPGNGGSRVYETTASPEALKTHYETLARTHGWNFSSPDLARLDMPPGEPFRGVIAGLVRDRFNFSVVVSPTSDGLPLTGGPYYPKAPMPAPAYTGPTPPPPPGVTPAPSPSVAPTPTPTPYAGAYYMRVEGNVQSR